MRESLACSVCVPRKLLIGERINEAVLGDFHASTGLQRAPETEGSEHTHRNNMFQIMS
jgi:hypothetical protein